MNGGVVADVVLKENLRQDEGSRGKLYTVNSCECTQGLKVGTDTGMGEDADVLGLSQCFLSQGGWEWEWPHHQLHISIYRKGIGKFERWRHGELVSGLLY